MNQTYLQGLASDMDGPDSAVFFEATPENIAAFLMRHQTAEKSAVGAADGRVLLTARMGFIDICPDQEYLTQKLLPLYSKIQVGELSAPPLKTVPKETALAGGCPRPDWNYLRFDGYSDKKYRALASGEAILPLQWYGETISMELQVRSYQDAGKLALLLVDWNDGEPEPWSDLTVNLGCPVEKDCAFIDINDLGPDILPSSNSFRRRESRESTRWHCRWPVLGPASLITPLCRKWPPRSSKSWRSMTRRSGMIYPSERRAAKSPRSGDIGGRGQMLHLAWSHSPVFQYPRG